MIKAWPMILTCHGLLTALNAIRIMLMCFSSLALVNGSEQIMSTRATTTQFSPHTTETSEEEMMATQKP